MHEGDFLAGQHISLMHWQSSNQTGKQVITFDMYITGEPSRLVHFDDTQIAEYQITEI